MELRVKKSLKWLKPVFDFIENFGMTESCMAIGNDFEDMRGAGEFEAEDYV